MKNLKTIGIIIVVGLLGFFAYKLATKQSGSQLASEALSDFEVKDTASINKLVITDTEGSDGSTLIRGAEGWTLESGACVQQHLVHTMLETIKYIKVKSPVPEGSIANVNKSLATHHVKMEIYVKDKLAKTWFIGDPTQDQYGTYMLLKDPEKGKSPEPFIMHLPNMYGNLSTRFIADPKLLGCTEVFSYDPIEIQSVEVTIPDSSHLNFKVVALDDNLFSVMNNQTKLEKFDTTLVRSYLLDYRKIHFENHNYNLSEANLDSLKKSTPFYKIKVTDKKGKTNQVKIYRRKYNYEKLGLDGKPMEFDQDRIWLELNDGTIVVAQYYVFGKLMRTIDYFKGPPPGLR